MGSEQSQLQQGEAAVRGSSAPGTLRSGSLRTQSTNATPTPTRSSAAGAKLHRGNTIAATEISSLSLDDGPGGTAAGPSFSTGTPSSAYICDSRPVSPPMSVCSDSDLPYISYTDKPIGGECFSKRSFYSTHILLTLSFPFPRLT